MGTLQSHDQEHLKCTEDSLPLENCKKIGLENSECSCSVQSGHIAVTLSMSLQCIWNVPARNTGSCPQCLHP
jgi:hypothetical protein